MEEKIAEILRGNMKSVIDYCGECIYADDSDIEELAHEIYGVVLASLAGGEMGDEEIKAVWPKAKDLDFPFMNQPEIEAELLKGAKAVAHAQAIRTRAQCEKEKQAKERILNPTVLLLSAPNVERPRNFNSNLVLWR